MKVWCFYRVTLFLLEILLQLVNVNIVMILKSNIFDSVKCAADDMFPLHNYSRFLSYLKHTLLNHQFRSIYKHF